MNRRSLRAPIHDRDADETFIRRRFGVFDEHVEVAVGVEGASVDRARTRSPRAACIRPYEVVLGERDLGSLYSHFMYEWVGVESR